VGKTHLSIAIAVKALHAGYTVCFERMSNLVSELYERASIIITSNKGFEEWAEMMGDEIMTTAMLDRLLHHAHIYALDGESYRVSKSQQTEKEEEAIVSV